jgi:hypothetical protein
MAYVKFFVCKLRTKDEKGGYSTIHDGEKTPTKQVEIKTLADALRELTIFAEELKSTGKPWTVSAHFVERRGDRRPNGFEAATRRPIFVNAHLVPASD